MYVNIAALLTVLTSALTSEIYRCPAQLQNQGNNLATYDEYCFHYVHGFVSWDTAKKNCEANGGYLAVVFNSALNDFLSQMLQDLENTPNAVWIGAHDLNVEGDWKWVNGTPWGFTNWEQGFPTYCFSLPCLKDCAYQKPATGKWEDTECTTTRTYVCQYGLGPTTTSTTTTTTITTTVPTTTTTITKITTTTLTTTTLPTTTSPTTTTLPTTTFLTTTTLPTTTTTPTTTSTVPTTTTTSPTTRTPTTTNTTGTTTSTTILPSSTYLDKTTTAIQKGPGSVGAVVKEAETLSEGGMLAMIVCILVILLLIIIIVALVWKHRRLKKRKTNDEFVVRFDNSGYTGVVMDGGIPNNSQLVDRPYAAENRSMNNSAFSNPQFKKDNEMNPYNTLTSTDDENPYKTIGAVGEDPEYDSIPADKLQDLDSDYLTPAKKSNTLKYDNVDMPAENLYTEMPTRNSESLENLSNRSTEELLQSFKQTELAKTPITYSNNLFDKDDEKGDEKDKGSDV